MCCTCRARTHALSAAGRECQVTFPAHDLDQFGAGVPDRGRARLRSAPPLPAHVYTPCVSTAPTPHDGSDGIRDYAVPVALTLGVLLLVSIELGNAGACFLPP